MPASFAGPASVGEDRREVGQLEDAADDTMRPDDAQLPTRSRDAFAGASDLTKAGRVHERNPGEVDQHRKSGTGRLVQRSRERLT